VRVHGCPEEPIGYFSDEEFRLDAPPLVQICPASIADHLLETPTYEQEFDAAVAKLFPDLQ